MSRLSDKWTSLKAKTSKMPDFLKIECLVVAMLLFVVLSVVTVRKLTSNVYSHKSACDLFSQKDADRMLGEGYKQDRPKDETNLAEIKFGYSTCGYSKGEYTDSNRSSVHINEIDFHSDKLEQSNLETFNKIMAGADKVQGPWDVAYYQPKNGNFSFKKGNYFVTVSFSESSRGEYDKDRSQEIATKIARKLRPY